MEEFTITIRTDSDPAVCVLGGAMDTHASDTIEEEFGKLLESGAQKVVLDLGKLEAVTSAAVGAFINLNGLLAARGGKLVLAAATPGTRGLLEMLGLGEILVFADSVDEAGKMVAAK